MNHRMSSRRSLVWGMGIVTAILFLPLGLGGCGGSDTGTQPKGPTPVAIEVPEGWPPFPVDDTNPLTVEGIALGRRLFYDRSLSGDYTQSCGDCHAPGFAFTDHGRAVSEGIDHIEGTRSAPAVINMAWAPALFWDGRVPSLEDQALQPVPNPIEMHLDWDAAEQRIRNDAAYLPLFQAAFGTDAVNRNLIVMAIAQFEGTLISFNSRYDRWHRREIQFTDQEQRGFQVFFTEKGDCFHCHALPFYTDFGFHNTGLDSVFTDVGLEETTGKSIDRGKFKTPTLRNIEYTAPYMHDGRFATLEDAVNHYRDGGVFTPTVDPLMRVRTGLPLTDQDVEDLVAFLKTLSEPEFLVNPDFQDPGK